MKLTPLCVASLAFLGIATVPGTKDAELLEQCSQALGLPLTESTEVPVPDDLPERIAKSTSRSPGRLDKVDVFSAPLGRRKASVGVLPIDDAGRRLIVCVGADGAFLRAAVLRADGTSDMSWRRMFVQLAQEPTPRIEALPDRAALTRLREADASEGDKLSAALARQRADMVAILETYMRIGDAVREGQPVPDDADRLVDRFEAYAEHGPSLASLYGDSVTRFQALAGEAADTFRKALASARAGEDPKPALKEAQATCQACHELPTTRPSTAQDAAAAARDERGIGDAFYVLGYDLWSTRSDRDQEQRMADDLWALVMMINAAVDTQ